MDEYESLYHQPKLDRTPEYPSRCNVGARLRSTGRLLTTSSRRPKFQVRLLQPYERATRILLQQFHALKDPA